MPNLYGQNPGGSWMPQFGTGNWAGSWGQRPQNFGNQSAYDFFNQNQGQIGNYSGGNNSLGGALRNWFPSGDRPDIYNPNPNNNMPQQAMARPPFGNGNPPINDAIPTAPIIQNPKYPTNPSTWANNPPTDNYVAPPRPVQQPYQFNPNSPTFHANRGMSGGIGGFRRGGWF